MPKLITLRSHEYAGRAMKEGDTYEADPIHADALIAVQASRLYESKDMKTVEPESEDETGKTSTKDKYKRRDLSAEK